MYKIQDFNFFSYFLFSIFDHALPSRNQHIFAALNEILQGLKIKQGLNSVASLTSNLHIWPDFHGNRSPLADPNLRGMVSIAKFLFLVQTPKQFYFYDKGICSQDYTYTLLYKDRDYGYILMSVTKMERLKTI